MEVSDETAGRADGVKGEPRQKLCVPSQQKGMEAPMKAADP